MLRQSGFRRVDPGLVAEIRSWPQVAGLSDRDVRSIARLVQRTTVPAGWAFITEGSPGDAAYLILKGHAQVTVRGDVVAELGPGAVTGEVALATEGLRTATVVAVTPCTFLHLDRASLDALRERCPAAHTVFMRYMEEQLAARRG